jgi:hypothetical protein
MTSRDGGDVSSHLQTAAERNVTSVLGTRRATEWDAGDLVGHLERVPELEDEFLVVAQRFHSRAAVCEWHAMESQGADFRSP